MGRPFKNKGSRNGHKSVPFQKCALVQWARHATNAYIGHQFEPRSRLARRATGFRRTSVRSTVSAHCSHQCTHTTHHTVSTRLRVAIANTGRRHRSAAAGNQLLLNKYVEYAGSGGNIRRCTGSAAFTTHRDTNCRSTTPAATSDDRRSPFKILIASTGVLGAWLAERTNMARIRPFSGINAHLFDRNIDSVMSRSNLATTLRQIGIKQLTSRQRVANVQGNLIGANAFLNLQPPQRRAMLTPTQITNNLLLGIITKSELQNQQLQISQAHTQVPYQAKFQQNLQLQQQLLTLNRAYSEDSQTQKQNTTARNSHTVMEIDMESEGRDITPPPLEAKINQASFNRLKNY
ncbi:MAG: hypothetical protein EZS28_015992 [Streblomastix strix]|uniref:Uncharacterized protein n=1 Tax=Streblomastix strix TaxID=222440 RepID=A0A5J4W0W4_9EUKA|nr:MAG: hypothetical protein EZS28_015992 [Streblomastix strix]